MIPNLVSIKKASNKAFTDLSQVMMKDFKDAKTLRLLTTIKSAFDPDSSLRAAQGEGEQPPAGTLAGMLMGWTLEGRTAGTKIMVMGLMKMARS